MDIDTKYSTFGVRDLGHGCRILILDLDLYRFVGGGQSVYQRLVALRPNDTFYYFRRQELPNAPRPPNAIAIPYKVTYQVRANNGLGVQAHFIWAYLECRNMAAAAREALGPGFDFDVADAPDYNQLGPFIRPALESEGLRVDTVAVAMHGTLSSAFRSGWPSGRMDDPMLAEMQERERLQFCAADARYAISTSYTEQWSRYAALAVNLLDPLCVVDYAHPIVPMRSSEAPDLAFIGRREKWKGPDLFLDAAWWIDPSLYRRLLVVGPDGPNHVGTGSEVILADIARQRNLRPAIAGTWSRGEVTALFAERTLLVLPSRHDTFNLTALEAIQHGCPVLVSDRAGVATWLRATLPELIWLVTDIDCSRSAAGRAAVILKDYDAWREKLTLVVQRRRLEHDMATVNTVYLPGKDPDATAQQTSKDLAARFAPLLQDAKAAKRRPGRLRSASITKQRLGNAGHTVLNSVRRSINRQRIKGTIREFTGHTPEVFGQINRARGLPAFHLCMQHNRETNDREVLEKITHLAREIPNRRIDRVRLFRELARLERRAGSDIVAATYCLRIMRWLGRDTFNDLPFVTAALEAEGFTHEVIAARAMFSDSPDTVDRCYALMCGSVDRNWHNRVRPFTAVDDRRGVSAPRVSVIVSLYNAATKLRTLLNGLSQQSLAKRGELEVILIDSNSPADEHGAFAAFAADSTLPVVYARSRDRETIQAAWNRGILLSSAPYLSFLGADEGLNPDALYRLASVLDANPGIDWATADSLVTSVDHCGVFEADVMPYDRRGYRQDLVYLETCYLSWVGGLYRRSIHDRFGWYDESFHAAGDTEFKSRILPYIRSARIPGTFGVFNNYPEDRTTQSPRAEIEDLRSWYLWRTPAGMRYAFLKRPAEDAAALFIDALSYRKSFCGHVSTDFDLATALAEYLVERPDAPAWATVALREARTLLSVAREMDFLARDLPRGPSGVLMALRLHRQLTKMRQLAVRHQSLFQIPHLPHYGIFNDNRHEQHWYSWSDR